jgi:hypothetical protein
MGDFEGRRERFLGSVVGFRCCGFVSSIVLVLSEAVLRLETVIQGFVLGGFTPHRSPLGVGCG